MVLRSEKYEKCVFVFGIHLRASRPSDAQYDNAIAFPPLSPLSAFPFLLAQLPTLNPQLSPSGPQINGNALDADDKQQKSFGFMLTVKCSCQPKWHLCLCERLCLRLSAIQMYKMPLPVAMGQAAAQLETKRYVPAVIHSIALGKGHNGHIREPHVCSLI